MEVQKEQGETEQVSEVQAEKEVLLSPGGHLTPRAPPRPLPIATCTPQSINVPAEAARGLGLRGRPPAVLANRESASPRGPRPPSMIGRFALATGRAVNQSTRRCGLTLAVPQPGSAVCRASGSFEGWGEGPGGRDGRLGVKGGMGGLGSLGSPGRVLSRRGAGSALGPYGR